MIAVGGLEGDNAVNAVGAKDLELAFIVAAKINVAAGTFARARERDLVNRADSIAVFVFKQNHRLAGDRRG